MMVHRRSASPGAGNYWLLVWLLPDPGANGGAEAWSWHPRSYCSGIVSPMPRGNPSPKLAITVAPDVHAQIIAAAAAEGLSVSAWMTAAARRALIVRDGLAAVAEWEAEHGALTGEELEAARQRIGAGQPERRSA